MARTQTPRKGGFDRAREVVERVTTDEVEEEALRRKMKEEDGKSESQEDGEEIPDRGEYWYSDLAETTDANETRSIENRIYLERIDLKVTWVIRILIAIISAGAIRYVGLLFGIEGL